MRAILREKFGGPENLVIREIPDPEPKPGHVVIQVKAFGINHAEMHMRRGEWAEAAEVSGIECVGLVKSCPGGEFGVGTKVAALMGGMDGQSTAATPSTPAHRQPMSRRSSPTFPGKNWPRSRNPTPRPGHACSATWNSPRARPWSSEGGCRHLGKAALNMAVNAGARVIATARNQDRFEKLEALGARRVEIEGPDLSQRIAERKEDRRRSRSRRQQHDPGFPRDAAAGRSRMPGGVFRRACPRARFQSIAADVERCPFQLLRQLCVRHTRLSSVGCPTPNHR